MKQAYLVNEKSMDSGALNKLMNVDETARKRSHEENQERAYVAASRRRDRCLQARVRSARMASEIHKKRTGKGFKITEEIVLKEEVYEEDNNDLRRSRRLHSRDIEASYTEGRTRLKACSSNKAKVSQMLARMNDEWRENEVNQLFARYFPKTVLAAQQVAQLLPTAATYEQFPQSHSHTTTATSYSRAAWIPAQVTPPPLSASINDYSRMFPNMSTSQISTEGTTRGINSTVSPWPPANMSSPSKSTHRTDQPSQAPVVLCEPCIDDVIAQEPTAQENQEYYARRTIWDSSDVLKAPRIEKADPKLVTDPYAYGTDNPMAYTGALPCDSDDNSWQEFVNENVWVTGQQNRYGAETIPPRERHVQIIVEGLAEMDQALRCFRKLQQEAIEASELAFNDTGSGGAKHETIHNAVPKFSRAH